MKKYLPKFQPGGSTPSKRAAAGKETISPLPGPTQLGTLKSNAQVMNPSGLAKPPVVEPELTPEQMRSKKAAGSAKGLSEGAATGLSTGAKIGGAVTDMLMSGVDVDENSSFKQEQVLGDALIASGNPYAAAAGLAVKLTSGLNQAMGTNMNTISKKEAAKIGVSGAGRVLNNVAGFMGNIGIPGIGAAFGETESVKMSELTKSMGSSYAGSVDDISTAEGMSGGRYIVGKGKINDLIREARRQNYLITDIAQTNTQRKMSDYGTDLAQQNLNRYAGQNYQNVHVGKQGMKLMNVDEIKRILELKKNNEVQSFQNGGIIGIDVNVIPEGKYHAHKNHLGELNDEFEDLTKKGIPVVTYSEGGEIEQVAEIEKMELIFRLEVTNKLEELFKDGSEEAMIEAGKLVAFEIMENTQDNSGEVLKDE